MLVIGRRPGEAVYIEHGGETLKITVEHANDKYRKIRLGFTGSKSFRIVRDDAKQGQEERGNGLV